jgi:hypothetical protein
MEVALFRFGLIAPLLNNQVDDSKAYRRDGSTLITLDSRRFITRIQLKPIKTRV